MTEMKNMRGSLSAFVTGLGILFVSFVGFSFDSGRLIAEYAYLSDIAGNAARIGAQEVTSIRSNDAVIDSQRARWSTTQVLRREGVAGNVDVKGGLVTVTVTRYVPFETLRLLGVPGKSVTLSRSAAIQVGK
jgi:Flp pilus assembly protein TadG